MKNQMLKKIMRIVLLSLVGVMIIAGVVAGYFPARKAVKIPVVEAMRAE